MPSTYEKRLHKMLFTYPSTNLSDYRLEESDTPFKTVYKPKPKRERKPFKPVKDIHTLTDWKSEPMPFDLHIKRKEIIRTNPYEPQRAYTKPIDEGHDLAVQTRPRLVMTPALSLDDMTNPVARALIIDDVYTSDMTKGLREGVTKCNNVTAPLPSFPAPARPVELPKLRAPMVSPEWRMETVSWDNQQLRAFCDPTGKFWLNMEVPKCRACDESQAVKAQRKMELQMAEGR